MDSMNRIEFECRYCGSVFEQRTPTGACPACGGPGPIRISFLRTEKFTETYTLQTSGRSKSTELYYYRPEPTNFRQTVFLNLGFRLTVVVGALILAAAVYFFYKALQIGTPDQLTGEINRLTAPTAEIIEANTQNIEHNKWWEENDISWLSPSESLVLRTERNVINLTILDQDGIKIAEDTTIILNENWEKRRPYFLEAMSIDGTAIVVQIEGVQYNLNIFMPFVWADTPNQVVIIDEKGAVWVISSDNATLVSIESVSLPIEINPNPNLEVSFSKTQ